MSEGATLPSPVRATRGGAADRKPHHRSASTAGHRGTLLPPRGDDAGHALPAPDGNRLHMLEGTVRLRFSWGDHDQSTATRGDRPPPTACPDAVKGSKGHPARGLGSAPIRCLSPSTWRPCAPPSTSWIPTGIPGAVAGALRAAYTEVLGSQRSREIGGLYVRAIRDALAPTATTIKAAAGKEG